MGFPATETYLAPGYDCTATPYWMFASLAKKPTWSGLYFGTNTSDPYVSFAAPVILSGSSSISAVIGVEYKFHIPHF